MRVTLSQDEYYTRNKIQNGYSGFSLDRKNLSPFTKDTKWRARD